MSTEITVSEILDFFDYAKKYEKLDINHLEDSIVNHPQYLDEVGFFYVKLLAISKTKEKMFKEIEAKVESEIRTAPDRFGITGKATEGAISSAVLLDNRTKVAKQDQIDSQLYANQAEVLYNAIQSKKSMIKHLVFLSLMAYRTNKEDVIAPGVDSDTIQKAIQARINANSFNEDNDE
jgi:hypothetical protein